MPQNALIPPREAGRVAREARRVRRAATRCTPPGLARLSPPRGHPPRRRGGMKRVRRTRWHDIRCDCQTAGETFSQRCAAPVVGEARGCAFLFFPLRKEGAERQAAPLKSTPCGAAPGDCRTRAAWRSTAAILRPGAVLPGTDGGRLAPRSGRLSPAFIRPASSPQGADPRSWVGRLPGASRARACEARTQAPRLAPPHRRL